MTDSPEPDVASDLITVLGYQGEHVDDGAFTLDSAAAFRKLREYQLADPHGYLLLLVEAAWLASVDPRGAEVRITTGATTTVEFGGLGLEHGALPELFSAVLGGLGSRDGHPLRRARILQLVGLAANSALALAPDHIVIDACDEHGVGERVRIDQAGGLTVEPAITLPLGTVRFAIDHTGFELGRSRTERRLLEQRCRFTQLRIVVDDETISQGPFAGLSEYDAIHGRYESITLDGAALSQAIGVVGYLPDRHAASTVWIVNRGVAYSDGGLGDIGIHIVVEVDLPIDLSRAKLLERPELDAVRAAIRAARLRLLPPDQRHWIARIYDDGRLAPKAAHRNLWLVFGVIILAISTIAVLTSGW